MSRQEGDGLQEHMAENCFYDCRSQRLSRAHQQGSPDSRHQSATELGSNCVRCRPFFPSESFFRPPSVHPSLRR